MSTNTRALAEFLAGLRYEDLPASVVARTEDLFLDWLGSALAGSLEKPARLAQRVARSLGSSDEATMFSAGRASASAAALANGVASHILELDDVHKGSTVHGAAPVITRVPHGPRPEIGRVMHLAAEPSRVFLFDAASGTRLR